MLAPLLVLLAASSCTPKLNHPRNSAITSSPTQIQINANSEGGTPEARGNSFVLPVTSIGGNYLKNVASGSHYKVRGGILNGP